MTKAKGIALNGVVLLDKPSGISSNGVLQRVRRLYNARKAGHTGSLDPLATGLLPICFGQATKACEYLLAADKRYVADLKLGAVTDTYDAEGEVTSRRDVVFDDDDLQAVLAQFRGTIEQVPPMYSALKKDGQPLYKMARKGEVIERPSRTMHVYELTAQRLEHDLLRIEVHSSSGFYVRSLAFDIGEALGCGAHIATLRRVEKQGLRVEQAHSLEDLQNKYSHEQLLELVQPVDILLRHLPRIELAHGLTDRLLNGLHTTINYDTADKGEQAAKIEPLDLCRIYRDDGYLFGVGELRADGQVKTHKIFVE